MKAPYRMGCYAIIAVLLFATSWQTVQAQIYIVVDKYTIKRYRLTIGNELHFKLKGEKRIRHDLISSLSMEDSTIGLSKASVKIKLDDVDQVYFYNKTINALQAGGYTIAGGFLIAAAVHPLVDNAQYDARESAIIGTTAFGITQLMRIFRRRSIKIGKNGRIRIIEIKWDALDDQ